MLSSPTRPLNNKGLDDRLDAIEMSYTGSMMRLVDLGRALMDEDGFIAGLVHTICHGLLSCPLNFQGPADMISALVDGHGTPGEWGEMHPESECAKIIADGIVYNAGLGRYVFGPDEIDRPYGAHRVPRLIWQDPRWLRQDTYTLQWYFMGRNGEVPVNPGDGEWVLYQPYPTTDAWRHGAVIFITLATIFARDAIFDQGRISEVCAPTRVATPSKPVSPAARKRVSDAMDKVGRQAHITLDHGWVYAIVSAAGGEWGKVCSEIISRSQQAVEVGLTGNRLSTESGSGFVNVSFYVRVNDARRGFWARSFLRTLREQGLVWWVRDNYGGARVRECPVPVWTTESPEDATARLKKLEVAGESIAKLVEGASKGGLDIDPSYLLEVLQGLGVRATQKAANKNIATLPLGVDAVNAAVRVSEVRTFLGLTNKGDPKEQQYIAEVNAGVPPPAPLPAPGAVTAPLPALPAAPAPEAAAREEDCDEDEEDCDERDRLAAAMSECGMDRCTHGLTHRCLRCGVRRVYRIENGAHVIGWRALKRRPVQAHTPAGPAGMAA